MSSVIIVDAARLSETPEAFQQYVKEFFAPKTVLGKECLVASTVLDWDYGHSTTVKGSAPSHSLDLRRFTEGLKKDESLNDWIRKADGTYLWQFYGRETHSCGACDDD